MNTQEIEVKVKKEHIKNGLPISCGQCPIALALLDALPKITDLGQIIVGRHYAVVTKNGLYEINMGVLKYINLPPIVTMFLRRFDAPDNFSKLDYDNHIKPFSFKVTIPKELV